MRFSPALIVLLGMTAARADDWPTELHDVRRSGATKETLQFPLKLTWVHHSLHAPQPGWPREAKADYYHNKYDLPERVTFDHAYHVVGADDRVYFGSSADDSVYCLDANNGAVRWIFTTEGPVRLAPTAAGELVVFGSDDGYVYAVKAKDGKLAWKRRLAPDDRQIPGNQRLISAWPVRTDVLVEGDKAYACAGLFPSWGVYQVTLNLKDGAELSRQTLKVTAQGYQERVFGKLMIGTGRNPAGAFVAKLERAGQEPPKEVKSLPKGYPFAFIRAGDVRIGGGDGKVTAFRDADGEEAWSAQVEGKVYSLAVVRGRLLASTDRGIIYCFTPDASGRVTGEAKPRPASISADVIRTADQLIGRANLRRGYALLLGDQGALALALSQRTGWQIIVREPDAARVEQMRKLIRAAGLSGRVALQHGALDRLPYTDMMFNLVVAIGAPTPREEIRRIVRPFGGLAMFSQDVKDDWLRGELPGAGEWTHMYAEPGNSACSNDQLAGNDLKLQWFGRPGPHGLIDRHHRTVSPLSKDGRLFVPGEDRITGVDAYNGTILWERDVPQSRRVIAFRDSSYLALSDRFLYVAAADKCLALNPDSGATRQTYSLPPGIDGQYEWGYTAAVEGLLLGSGVKAGSIRRQQSHANTVTITHWDFAPAVGSDFLFAYGEGGRNPAWVYRPHAGLIVNPTLTVSGGRIYFIESGNPATLKAPSAQVRLPALLAEGSTLVALDLKTGRELWRRPGEPFTPIQHVIFGSCSSDVLLIVGSRNSGQGKSASLWFDLHAFDAATGKPLWSRSQDQQQPINGEHGEQDRHPAIVSGRVYCEPKAYDLKTGEPAEWKWPWGKNTRRGCGTLSASASCFFFRHDTADAFDLEAGEAKAITAETRPGCWINLIPAGGLVLAPEASSGCTCNYAVQTSLALIPAPKK